MTSDLEKIKLENQIIKEENNQLKEENNKLKEHLKKYTAPTRRKKYYENHKEELNTKAKEYKIINDLKYKPTKEKKQEYNKKYYLKKKENNIKNDNDNT
jgi:hypothetical protein